MARKSGPRRGNKITINAALLENRDKRPEEIRSLLAAMGYSPLPSLRTIATRRSNLVNQSENFPRLPRKRVQGIIRRGTKSPTLKRLILENPEATNEELLQKLEKIFGVGNALSITTIRDTRSAMVRGNLVPKRKKKLIVLTEGEKREFTRLSNDINSFSYSLARDNRLNHALREDFVSFVNSEVPGLMQRFDPRKLKAEDPMKTYLFVNIKFFLFTFAARKIKELTGLPFEDINAVTSMNKLMGGQRLSVEEAAEKVLEMRSFKRRLAVSDRIVEKVMQRGNLSKKDARAQILRARRQQFVERFVDAYKRIEKAKIPIDLLKVA